MREAFELMLHGGLSAAAEYETRHPDYIMEMPQSGERRRDAMRAMQEAYPTPPTITVRRVVGGDRTWVLEGVNDYAGDTWHVVAIFEFDADGRVLRDTRYYGQPFAAPGWRADWTERI